MSSDDDSVEIPGRRHRSGTKPAHTAPFSAVNETHCDEEAEEGYTSNSEQLSLSDYGYDVDDEVLSDGGHKGKSVIGPERVNKSHDIIKKKPRYVIHEISDDEPDIIGQKRIGWSNKRKYTSCVIDESSEASESEFYITDYAEFIESQKMRSKHGRQRSIINGHGKFRRRDMKSGSNLGINKEHNVVKMPKTGSRDAVQSHEGHENQVRVGGQAGAGKNYEFRSNVQSAIKAIRNLDLNKPHLDAIMRTPFWHFIDACIAPEMPSIQNNFYKSDAIIRAICKRYAFYDSKMGFQFGRTFRSPKSTDMAIIFGIRDGKWPIVIPSGAFKYNDFVQRCFPGKLKGESFRLDKGHIESSLNAKLAQYPDKQCCEDVATLLHLLLLSILFLPKQKNYLNWRITDCIGKFETICSYDWSAFLLKSLMDDVHGVQKNKSGSCAVFLLFWLCEISGIIEPVPQAKLFPRFLKWSFIELRNALKDVDISILDNHYKLKSRLKLTPEEESIFSMVIGESSSSGCTGDGLMVENAPESTELSRKSSDGGRNEYMNEAVQPDPVQNILNCEADPKNSVQSISAVCDSKPPRFSNAWLDMFSPVQMPSFDLFPPTQAQAGKQNVEVVQTELPDKLTDSVNADASLKDSQISILSKSLEDAKKEIDEYKEVIAVHEAFAADAIDFEAIRGELERKNAQMETMRVNANENEAKRIRLSNQCNSLITIQANLEKEKHEVTCRLLSVEEEYKILQGEHAVLIQRDEAKSIQIMEIMTQNQQLCAELRYLKEKSNMNETSMLAVVPATNQLNIQTTPTSAQIASPKFNSSTCTPKSCVPHGLPPRSPVSLSTSQPHNRILFDRTPERNSNSYGKTPKFYLNSGSAHKTPTQPCLIVSEVQVPDSDVVVKSDSPDTNRSIDSRKKELKLVSYQTRVAYGVPVPICYLLMGDVPFGNPKIRLANINRKTIACTTVVQELVDWTVAMFRVKLEGSSILHVESSYSFGFLRLMDFELIMNNELYNDAIVDSWGLLVQQNLSGIVKLKETRQSVVSKLFIFHSFIYICMERKDGNLWYRRFVNHFVDNKIADAIVYDDWLFPMFVCGHKDPKNHDPDRWILLHFNLSTCKWTCYNPQFPKLGEEDTGRKAANVLINHVETKIGNYCQATSRRDIPISKETHVTSVKNYIDTPQRQDGESDCGVIVCSLVEKLLGRKAITRTLWSEADCGNYRAHMLDVY